MKIAGLNVNSIFGEKGKRKLLRRCVGVVCVCVPNILLAFLCVFPRRTT